MTGSIYKITSPDGCVYIGQTYNLVIRRRGYGSFNKKNSPLAISIRKYGFPAHQFDILTAVKDCSPQLLDELEKHYIRLYNSFRKYNVKGFNLNSGGKSPSEFLDKHTKGVYKYNLNGELVGFYPRLKEAAESCDGDKRNISACAHGKKNIAYGFIWLFDINPAKVQDKVDRYNNMLRWKESGFAELSTTSLLLANQKLRKKTIDISTNLVFDSIKDAASSVGISDKRLSAMLSGKRKNITNIRLYGDN